GTSTRDGPFAIPPFFSHNLRCIWSDPDDNSGDWVGVLKAPGKFGVKPCWYFFVSKEDAKLKGQGEPTFSIELWGEDFGQIREEGDERPRDKSQKDFRGYNDNSSFASSTDQGSIGGEEEYAKIKVGEKVEAIWQGDGGMYPAVIKGVYGNGDYYVSFNDGYEEVRVAPGNVRRVFARGSEVYA
ncbi:hypothetical protein TrRE_jg3381, partial [Triparma retinervis]